MGLVNAVVPRGKLIEGVSSFTVDRPIGPLQGYAYRSPFDPLYHAAFVYNGVGDGHNVLTRFHKPNIVKDIFFGSGRINAALERFKKNGSGVLVYLRDGAVGEGLTRPDMRPFQDALRAQVEMMRATDRLRRLDNKSENLIL